MSGSVRLCFIVALAAVLPPPGAAAQVPDTDIWVADIKGSGESLRFETPVNVTRRPGYDNQPAFLHPRSGARDRDRLPEILYTSADSLGATDIFRWDPYKKTSVQVTRTPESEYSPTPIHAASGAPAGFCVVRVEADSTQRLWRFDLDGSNPRLVMVDVDSVGYFAWIDEEHVAVFVLGNEKRKEPHTLRVVNVEKQSETIVARDIGRAIHLIPGSRDISFTVHEPDDTYRFLILKHGRAAGEPLIDATATGQDAAWYGETMLMSAGTTIYAAKPLPGRRNDSRRGVWRAVNDFAGHGISGITRIAVAPDQRKIAFVATTGGP